MELNLTTEFRALTEDDRQTLTSVGGFTHPLFVDPAAPATIGMSGRPFPGQALLLFAGGLIEGRSELENAVALLGFDSVRFLVAAIPGDKIAVEVKQVGREPWKTNSEREIVLMTWRIFADSGRDLAIATARMLMKTTGGKPTPGAAGARALP